MGVDVLREGDRTGVAIFPSGGATFDGREHRVSLVYRRDNRGIDPASQVLR